MLRCSQQFGLALVVLVSLAGLAHSGQFRHLLRHTSLSVPSERQSVTTREYIVAVEVNRNKLNYVSQFCENTLVQNES